MERHSEEERDTLLLCLNKTVVSKKGIQLAKSQDDNSKEKGGLPYTQLQE